MTGLDTGFFFRLVEGVEPAVERFDQLLERDEEAAVSTITIYELLKHGLRGSLPQDIAEMIVDESKAAFVTAGVDDRSVLERAARLSLGAGLSMADSLIAASLEHVGCAELHTTDGDFDRYEGPLRIVQL